jgi:hypothetical protein
MGIKDAWRLKSYQKRRLGTSQRKVKSTPTLHLPSFHTRKYQRQACQHRLRALRIFFCSCDRLRPRVGYREAIATHLPPPIIPIHIKFLSLPHTLPLVSLPIPLPTPSLPARAPPQSPLSRPFRLFFVSRTEHRPFIRPIPLPPQLLPTKTIPRIPTPPCA